MAKFSEKRQILGLNCKEVSPNQTGGVNDQHLIVRIHVDGLDKVGIGQIGQEIEDILEVVHDLMIHGEAALDHLGEVALHLIQLDIEAFEAHQLVGDTLRECAHSRVLDHAE